MGREPEDYVDKELIEEIEAATVNPDAALDQSTCVITVLEPNPTKLLPAPTIKVRHGRAPTPQEKAEIAAMLSYRRDHDSKGELKFVKRFILPLNPGFDEFGNMYVRVGDAPETLFSAHVDDVDNAGGRRGVFLKGGNAYLKKGSQAHCLGADNAAGCWLLMELCRAKVPGLYIWHRAEECGGKGSKFFVKENRPMLTGIKRAIAFDRRSVHSIITHQRSERCCSDTFADELAEKLSLYMPNALMTHFKKDDTGSFTDTANYTDIVAECTNISVGFYEEHSRSESLDLWHLCGLRDACLKVRWDDLPTVRDPKKPEFKYSSYSHWSGSTYNGPTYSRSNESVLTHSSAQPKVYIPKGRRHDKKKGKGRARILWDKTKQGVTVPAIKGVSPAAWAQWEHELMEADTRDSLRGMTLEQLVEEFPREVADILESCGYSPSTLADDIARYWPLG